MIEGMVVGLTKELTRRTAFTMKYSHKNAVGDMPLPRISLSFYRTVLTATFPRHIRSLANPSACRSCMHTRVQGNAKLPGIMAVGYIAAFSETLALAVIVSKGVPPLKDVS